MKKLYQVYKACKAKHEDHITFVRDTDYYYTFESDAIKLHKVTGMLTVHITINEKDVRMAMLNRKTLERFLPTFTKAGYKVAIKD